MKIAYFDCFSGISGDMTLAALVDAGAELNQVQSALDSMGLDSVRLAMATVRKNGFRASHLKITHPPEHVHRNFTDIAKMIDQGGFAPAAKSLAIAVFDRIAVAEAKVHGVGKDHVHFHEVGAIDSIADIVGVAVAWESLAVAAAYAAPVPVGAGEITIAHGTVSVPAPATAEILRGIPINKMDIQAELTTPTGAAILAELVTGFGSLPSMQVERIGYGAGTRDLPSRPNMLRVLIGEAVRLSSKQSEPDILVLETNLDDATGEEVGHVCELLLKSGALDVFSTPVQMKKNRPGILLTVLCLPEDREKHESILFRNTSTLGIRCSEQSRSVLERRSITVNTTLGPIRGKISRYLSDAWRFSPEYEDCRRTAMTTGQTLEAVQLAASKAWDASNFNESAPTIWAEKEKSAGVCDDHAIETESGTHDHSHDHSHDHDDSRAFRSLSEQLRDEESGELPGSFLADGEDAPRDYRWDSPSQVRGPHWRDDGTTSK